MEEPSEAQSIDEIIETIAGNKHICTLCLKEFGTRWGTRRHVKAVHAESGLQTCPHPFCGEKFRSHNQMRTHAIFEHGEQDLFCPHEGCEYECQDING